MIPAPFLILTFSISLAGFACVALLPAARSPDSLTGLPFWLIMVWGPSLAALILAAKAGTVSALLGRVVQLGGVPPEAWALILAPLILVWLLRPYAPDSATPLALGTALGMVGFNLILGPLGEELGWRGYLQDHVSHRLGWLLAAVSVGVIWAIWHLPLWLVDSPHAQISLPLYSAHVLLYAVIIGAAHHLSGGSLLPAVLLHLTLNLAANYAVFAGFAEPNAWFRTSLLPFALVALGAALLVWLRTGETGLAALR